MIDDQVEASTIIPIFVVVLIFIMIVLFCFNTIGYTNLLTSRTTELENYCFNNHHSFLNNNDDYMIDYLHLDYNFRTIFIQPITSLFLDSSTYNIRIDCSGDIVNATAIVNRIHTTSKDKWGDDESHTSHKVTIKPRE